MKLGLRTFLFACASLILGPLVLAQNSPSAQPLSLKGTLVSTHATGSFEVKLKVAPQISEESGQHAGVARLTIDKQFHGALEARSQGQMLTAATAVKGSAGYVAIEKVTGTLNGRRGSFILQHNATMNRGVPQLNIIVVPDSGTDQLVGLAGKMDIIVADGKHSYDFDYTLPESQ
jgi:Protein of unknown function (DUF3224)